MRSDEQITSEDNDRPKPRPRLEFFYYEQVGSHYYLRLTWLTVILVVGLTVVSLAMILAIFFLSDRPDPEKDVNLNITAPSRSPYSPDKPILRQPPSTPLPPKVGIQSKSSVPTPTSTPAGSSNTNEQIVPKQSPRLPLSKPPT